MKLMKTTPRKKYYHTSKCMVIQKLGRDRFTECTQDDIDTYELQECGHCSGVEKTSGDRSYYLKARAMGEAE
jgi:excinuclease UvrABC helicase subunit UvrB